MNTKVYDCVMEFVYDAEYNERLFSARNLTFSDALQSICDGRIRAHLPYPAVRRSGLSERRVFIVSISGRAHFLPYRVSGKEWVLETVYPCSRPPMPVQSMHESIDPMAYLNAEEEETIEPLKHLNLKGIEQNTPGELGRMKRAAKKRLRREKRGPLGVSADSVERTREHAGKLGSQTGVMKQW